MKFSNDLTGLGVKASMSAWRRCHFLGGIFHFKVHADCYVYDFKWKVGLLRGKQIKVDFTFDLGGGATFEAGIEKLDDEHISYPGGCSKSIHYCSIKKDNA